MPIFTYAAGLVVFGFGAAIAYVVHKAAKRDARDVEKLKQMDRDLDSIRKRKPKQ